MSTETTSLDDLDFTPSGLAVGEDVADLLFREARTVNTFADGDVTDEQIRAVYDLVRWGPTMLNTVPLRLLVVRTREGRERLAAHEGDPRLVARGLDAEDERGSHAARVVAGGGGLAPHCRDPAGGTGRL